MLTLILLLAVVVGVFTIMSKGQLLNPKNIRNILQSITLVSLLTIGAGMLMIGGYVDLSLGGIGTMAALITAYALRAGAPWYLALIIGLVAGAVTGAFNAVLINELRFQPFIATLATASITQGLGYIVNHGQQIDIDNPVFNFIGTQRIADFIPYSIIISLVLLAVYGVMLKNTKFGRSMYLVGGNPQASLLSGLHPKRVSYILFINAGVLSSLAGILLAARLKTANTTGIVNQQFSGMTAAILGGISFGGGSGGMGGALIGILILNCFNNGMTIVRVTPYWQTVASGALLLIALAIDFLRISRTKKVS
jgi:ribose/xylose/arabinose/galactoside ABC-type transport system permease subunit